MIFFEDTYWTGFFISLGNSKYEINRKPFYNSNLFPGLFYMDFYFFFTCRHSLQICICSFYDSSYADWFPDQSLNANSFAEVQSRTIPPCVICRLSATRIPCKRLCFYNEQCKTTNRTRVGKSAKRLAMPILMSSVSRCKAVCVEWLVRKSIFIRSIIERTNLIHLIACNLLFQNQMVPLVG